MRDSQIIREARTKHVESCRKSNEESERRDAEIKKEMRDKEALFKNYIAKHISRATPRDYTGWLVGYLENGGDITHNYDYDLPDDFYIAHSDFQMSDFYGAMSFNVIIPVGVEVGYGKGTHWNGIGHCSLYFMDGFREVNGFVPCYDDVL